MIRHVKWLAVMASLWALFGCSVVPKVTYHQATVVTTEGVTKAGRPYALSEVQLQSSRSEPVDWVK